MAASALNALILYTLRQSCVPTPSECIAFLVAVTVSLLSTYGAATVAKLSTSVAGCKTVIAPTHVESYKTLVTTAA